MATRREWIEAIADRYHAAARAEKKVILDEFTGYPGAETDQTGGVVHDRAVVTTRRRGGPACADYSLGSGGPDLRKATESSDPAAGRAPAPSRVEV